MLIALLLYSIVGAVCFVALEQQNEHARRNLLRTEALLRSEIAKREFIQEIKVLSCLFFFAECALYYPL
ncbi:unnamed protein product [Gongylonema pulchrum]|uniref:Ion_trans_2 domain-containing protein n=1 Tax=Gongylonema pulchrum TaxID=637853 RepID=A0A183EWL9_9BILA|nr:unnamed protein product [Gongylonema pulchrum]